MTSTYTSKTFTERNNELTKLVEKSFAQCTFSGISFEKILWQSSKFDSCTFKHCTFIGGVVEDCFFEYCSFSSCRLNGMTWLSMRQFHEPSISFSTCQLQYTRFEMIDFDTSSFTSCDCMHTEFSQVDLRKVTIEDCTFGQNHFEKTDFRDVDMRKNSGFIIDIGKNKTKGMIITPVQAKGIIAAQGIRID